MKKIWIWIMLALWLFSGCEAEKDPEATQQHFPPEATTAVHEETTAPITTPETTPEEVGVPQGWYLPLLDQAKELREYSFFDLDGDGVEELIMKTGASEADTRYVFYGYHDAACYLGEAWHSSSTLVSEGDGLIIYGGKQGYEWAFRIIKEGMTIREEMLFDRELTGEYRRYPMEVEVYVPDQPKQPEQTGLWAQYAQEAFYGAHISFTVDEPEEYIVEIAVFTDTEVTQFRLYRLESNMAGESTLAQTVFTLEEFTPEKPVVLGVTFGEIFPFYGIGYTDSSGDTHYYAFGSSMMDGSLEFYRFYPGKSDPEPVAPEQEKEPVETQEPVHEPVENVCGACGQYFSDSHDQEMIRRHGYCWNCFWLYDGAQNGMCMQCGAPMVEEEGKVYDGARCEDCHICDRCGVEIAQWEYQQAGGYLCENCFQYENEVPNVICPGCGKEYFVTGVGVEGMYCGQCGYEIVSPAEDSIP